MAPNRLILHNLLRKEAWEKPLARGMHTLMVQGEKPKENRSMSEFQETANTTATPRWVGLAVAVLGGISLLGLGVSWSALNQAKSIDQSTQAVRQANEALTQRVAKADEINQQLQSDVKVVTDKLKVTQSVLIAARKQNKNATTAVDQKVTNLATSVKAELATKANTDDVNKLNGDVTGVRTDLDAAKGSIQMARSEMGTLIARNHDEIDQLRRMGQRDYFEFTVQRKSGATKVGTIQIQLKDTNTKKNRYTINVLADDNSFEKKDRSVNEPIFFYTGGTRQAIELVVNKVTKSTATGYLSVPKATGATSASTATPGQ